MNKITRLKKCGLIGCLNDTGVTSTNYRDEIERIKYYGGFAVGREKMMFDEELKELNGVYHDALDEVTEERHLLTEDLVDLMEKFVEMYRQEQACIKKIEVLEHKMGHQQYCGGSVRTIINGGTNV